MATMPTRIDQELFDAARAAGEMQSRSAAQQLAHWARLGRQVEASPAIDHTTVARALSGQLSYDELGSSFERAAVRSEWDARLQARISTADLSAPLREAGLTWSELDDDGNVVTRSSPE